MKVAEFPEPCGSLSTGRLILDGYDGALSYSLRPDDNDKVRWAVLHFKRAPFAASHGMNDEANHHHPYARMCYEIGALSIAEILNSRFALECDRRCHRDGIGWKDAHKLRHLLFWMKGNSVEIVAHEISLYQICDTLTVALDAMVAGLDLKRW